MASKIYLNTIDEPAADDSVFSFPEMPAFVGGDEDENLACGSCKTVVGRNISTRDVYQLLGSAGRIVVRCDCGAYVIIPSQRAH